MRVIDYKTGKPKSRNFILGKVASADLSEREQQLPESLRGKYKRQLLFYKLLTQLDKSFLPTVEEGMLEFVESAVEGKLTQHVFVLRDEDVEELKQLIKEVMAEILGLKF